MKSCRSSVHHPSLRILFTKKIIRIIPYAEFMKITGMSYFFCLRLSGMLPVLEIHSS